MPQINRSLGSRLQLSKLEMPNSSVFVVCLCANIVEYKSEMRYNFIDYCYVSRDCTLLKSTNLQLFAAAGGEGGQVQI